MFGRACFRLEDVWFGPTPFMRCERIEKTLLAVVRFATQISKNIRDMPGCVAERIISLPKTIRLASSRFRHVMAIKKFRCLLASNFQIPLRATVDFVALIKA
jgi:hypothetical protein